MFVHLLLLYRLFSYSFSLLHIYFTSVAVAVHKNVLFDTKYLLRCNDVLLHDTNVLNAYLRSGKGFRASSQTDHENNCSDFYSLTM